MDSLIFFLHIIAWIFGVCSTLLLILRIVGAATYSKIDKLLDDIKGQKRSWPVMWPAIISIICWAFIIAF